MPLKKAKIAPKPSALEEKVAELEARIDLIVSRLISHLGITIEAK